MYRSTSDLRMPSMILSKAANTPVVGPAAGVVRFDVAGVGEGVAVASVVFGLVLGDGVGFASTVRVRLEGDVTPEFEFCAKIVIAPASNTEAMTRSLFIMLLQKVVSGPPRWSTMIRSLSLAVLIPGIRSTDAGCATASPNVRDPLSQTRQTLMVQPTGRSALCAKR